MPDRHAVVSASAAHRWLNCPGAPRYEQQFPEESSIFADEGTLAHSICEYAVNASLLHERLDIDKFRSEPLFQEEMIPCAKVYWDYITEQYNSFAAEPLVCTEVELDLSNYVPEGFGTSDCVLVGADRLQIVDYKHGKGVKVEATDNPQLKLYALGALDYFSPVYGDIKTVKMSIVQPRITEEVEEFEMTAADLRAWGESIKPIAKKAFDGCDEYHAGDWCRFCKGRAQCRARAEMYQSVQNRRSNLLTVAEMAQLLTDSEGFDTWLEDLKKQLTAELLNGTTVPGYKLVEGRSNRKFTDEAKAYEALIERGVPKALIYDYVPKTLSKLEAFIGKKRFTELASDLITKPAGAPTLARDTDKRDAITTAELDFKDIKE